MSVLWHTGHALSRGVSGSTLASEKSVGYAAAVKFLRGSLRQFSLGLAFRRMLKSLDRLDARVAEQNLYLKRLADHFAPEFSEQDAPTDHGVDYLNAVEAGLVMDYVERTQRDTGKTPTDDEILRFLADEATIDLAARRSLEDER